jgi:hypothetical protein
VPVPNLGKHDATNDALGTRSTYLDLGTWLRCGQQPDRAVFTPAGRRPRYSLERKLGERMIKEGCPRNRPWKPIGLFPVRFCGTNFMYI